MTPELTEQTENVTPEVEETSVAYDTATDATEVVKPSKIGSLQYGDRTYEIKPMNMDQIIAIGRFVGNTFQKMQSETQKELIANGATEGSVLLYFNHLDRDDIPTFISLITGETDLEFIRDNFNLADTLGVIITWGKIEKIADVFTRLGELGEMFQGIIPQAK